MKAVELRHQEIYNHWFHRQQGVSSLKLSLINIEKQFTITIILVLVRMIKQRSRQELAMFTSSTFNLTNLTNKTQIHLHYAVSRAAKSTSM